MNRNPQKRPRMCKYVECYIVGRPVSYYAMFIEHSAMFITALLLYMPPLFRGV